MRKTMLVLFGAALVALATLAFAGDAKAPPYASWEAAADAFTLEREETCTGDEVAALGFDPERGWSMVAGGPKTAEQPTIVVMGPNKEPWSLILIPGTGVWEAVYGPIPDGDIVLPELCDLIGRARQWVIKHKATLL